MFNAIANTLFLAARNETGAPTHRSELFHQEERKREELHRQQLNARFYRRRG